MIPCDPDALCARAQETAGALLDTTPPPGHTRVRSATMSEINTNVASAEAETVHAQEQVAQAEARQEATAQAEAIDAQEARALEKESARIIRQAVAAFRKGTRGLLVSRVEAGRHCADFFSWRRDHGFKDRDFSTKLLFNALAVYADSAAECNPNTLAKLHHTVHLLAPRTEAGAVDDCWKDSGLTVSKLEALSGLTFRAE